MRSFFYIGKHVHQDAARPLTHLGCKVDPLRKATLIAWNRGDGGARPHESSPLVFGGFYGGGIDGSCGLEYRDAESRVSERKDGLTFTHDALSGNPARHAFTAETRKNGQ